jgi:hypothetical protein
MTNTQGQTGSLFTSASSNQGAFQPFALCVLPNPPRDPTPQDVTYNLLQLWYNITNQSLWFLASFSSAGANLTALWVRISQGPGNLESLTADSGGPVFPTLGNINLNGLGAISTAGTPATSTITVQVNLPVANDVLYSLTGSPGTFGGVALMTSMGIPQILSGRISGVPVPTNVVGAGSVTVGYTDGNPATITITGSPSALTYTNVVGPVAYVVLLTDQYISCNTSGGAVTLRFPDAPPPNQVWSVKDRTGNASTNNITITSVGGAKTFDGFTSFLLKGNFDAQNLIFNGSQYELF